MLSIPGWRCAKNRGGRQGQEYPFALRVVEAPEPDEDGEPVSTMVVDWNVTAADGAYTTNCC